MCLTKLLTSNNEMKTLQSNHVPPRTNNLVWLRGNAASSHPCKSSGSSYEEFPIPDGLVRSSRPTSMYWYRYWFWFWYSYTILRIEVLDIKTMLDQP